MELCSTRHPPPFPPLLDLRGGKKEKENSFSVILSPVEKKRKIDRKAANVTEPEMIRQGYKGHLGNNSTSDLSAVPTVSSSKENRASPAKAIENLFAGDE